MEFKRWTRILSGRAIFWKLAGWWTIKRLFISIRPARRRTVQRICQNSNTTMQFIINTTDQSSALKLIRSKSKSGEHDDENQAIPDLQSPFDGVKNFHSMQYPWPRRVTMNSAPSFLRTLET